MNGKHRRPHNNQPLQLALAGVCVALLSGCIFDDDDNPGESASTRCTVTSRIWGTGDAGLVNGCQPAARFSNPVNVEVSGNVRAYVADFDNDVVRAIALDGRVTTLVTMPANSRPFGLTLGMGLDSNNLYVQTDGNANGERDSAVGTGTLWRVNLAATPVVATVIATGLGRPRGIQALPDGRIAMSDYTRHDITVIDPDTAMETPLAGTEALVADGPGDFANGVGEEALFNQPYGMGLLDANTLLVADKGNHCLRQVTLEGVVTTFAGICEMSGDDNGTLDIATFNAPQDVAIAGGNIYVADIGNHLIRRINGGSVFTQAGNGMAGFVDDTGTNASFFGMEGIAISADGSVLVIADGTGGEDVPFNRVRILAVP